MKPTILLLSGTSEGPLLARALLDAGCDVRTTVTRSLARQTLFGELLDRVDVEARGFTEQSLAELLATGTIAAVLDATHPFAARITAIAHLVCTQTGTPYVRFERADWEPPTGAIFAETFAESAAMLPGIGRRIMLTIGSKQLKHFAGLHDRLTLFARILPAVESLEQALQAGFTGDRVLCLRPPFSRDFNRAIFQEYGVDVLVTKASGIEGGVAEKVLAATDLGMKVLVIRRPVLPGIATVGTVDEAVHACLRLVTRS